MDEEVRRSDSPAVTDILLEFVQAHKDEEKSDPEIIISFTYPQAFQLIQEINVLRVSQSRKDYLESIFQLLQDWLDQHEGAHGLVWVGPLPERVERVLSRHEHDHAKALELLGSLVENQIISLRAIQMIVKQSRGGTHRQIEQRLDIVDATIQEAINALLQDRENHWEFMEFDVFGRKDWDFRRLASENFRLRRDLEEARKNLMPEEG